jgi:uracil-DNA glycosylase
MLISQVMFYPWLSALKLVGRSYSEVILMTTHPFSLDTVHHSWLNCLQKALSQLDPLYLKSLSHSKQWLPGPQKIFSAFSLPLNQVKYVLFGESPYPRIASANGYAFWDASVKELWSANGMSKTVNRATSLRNLLKMLLIAEGLLDPKNTGQEAIAKIDKPALVQTNQTFFSHLLQEGFLLLNATPVLQSGPPQKDARAWVPFMRNLLTCLLHERPATTLILFGRIASNIEALLPRSHTKKIYAEHPYNLTFITNPVVLNFFRPFHLLRA